MTAKALGYAENVLGVHSVYTGAVEARDKLDVLTSELSTLHDRKRMLTDRMTDREMEIASDERGKHPDMSQASMDKHMKVAVNSDPAVRALRDELRSVNDDIDGLEYDVRMVEHDIKIAVARMTELGGYLNYLAAVKQATTPRSQEAEKQEQPT